MNSSYLNEPKEISAIFLDRDGVIIDDKEGYISEISKLKFIEGAIDGLRLLQRLEYKLIIITNQAGIAKGRFLEEDYHRFTVAYLDILKRNEVDITKVYYCNHFKGAKIEKYNIDCDCRKPKDGLIKKALAEFNINLNDTYIIGDKPTDIETAKNYPSIKKIGVLSGEGSKKELREAGAELIYQNLLEAAEKIAYIKGYNKK